MVPICKSLCVCVVIIVQPDGYLDPEVRYCSFPPSTLIKLGGRDLEIDRAVGVKIRLLEPDEDRGYWCNKKQHSRRINCGEYHKDFGDVEIGYSFSSPQTHIWFAGYAIHSNCFENIAISSFNSTIRITPEHIMPRQLLSDLAPFTVANEQSETSKIFTMNDLKPTRSLFEMVIEEGADFPIYTAAVPKRVDTSRGPVTELLPTAEFVNDCERDIIIRNAWDTGAPVSQISYPVSLPPTYPPVRPFEHQALFWSFINNKLLEMRLSRDDLIQSLKDIALLSRFRQYSHEKSLEDRHYQKALDRLARLFNTKEAIHDAAWPTTQPSFKPCQCVDCTDSLAVKTADGDFGKFPTRVRASRSHKVPFSTSYYGNPQQAADDLSHLKAHRSKKGCNVDSPSYNDGSTYYQGSPDRLGSSPLTITNPSVYHGDPHFGRSLNYHGKYPPETTVFQERARLYRSSRTHRHGDERETAHHRQGIIAREEVLQAGEKLAKCWNAPPKNAQARAKEPAADPNLLFFHTGGVRSEGVDLPTNVRTTMLQPPGLTGFSKKC